MIPVPLEFSIVSALLEPRHRQQENPYSPARRCRGSPAELQSETAEKIELMLSDPATQREQRADQRQAKQCPLGVLRVPDPARMKVE